MAKKLPKLKHEDILPKINQLAAGPDDILELGKRLSRLGVFSGGEDPFAPSPSYGEVDGQIHLGTVFPSGSVFGLDFDELGEHTIISGRSGSGKTTLIYTILIQLIHWNIPFFAFDFKQDYRHILNYSDDVYVFDASNFRYNPLRPPPGIHPQIWMSIFVNVFSHANYLLAASKNVLQDNLNELYLDYGILPDGSGEAYPTILDLKDKLHQFNKKNSAGRANQWIQSCINRIDSCAMNMGQMLGVDKGFSIEDLLKKNVVFELYGIPDSDMAPEPKASVAIPAV